MCYIQQCDHKATASQQSVWKESMELASRLDCLTVFQHAGV